MSASARFLGAALAVAAVLGAQRTARAAECTADEAADLRAQLRAPATAAGQSVTIDCRLDLDFDRDLAGVSTVTKRIIIKGAGASGTTIDCSGGTIDGGSSSPNYQQTMVQIQSVKSGTTWSRPYDVTVRHCTIKGRIHTIGIGSTANDPKFHDSSRMSGHIGRVRAAAPRKILLDDLTMIAQGRIALYLGPGTTEVTLRNSEILGTSNSTAIYLGAETTRTVIRNNYIHPATTRELIAVDASDHNRIINNRFSSLNHGGIYLYRNCGEDHVSRHTTPSYNHIVNNVFYYNKYTGSNPSVYLGSRNTDRPYCDKDDDSDFGSGVSDHDWARYNVVMQNQIYKRSVADMIRTRDTKSYPNYLGYNETVTAETYRLAGCYVAGGYDRDFLFHGERTDVFADASGAPVCSGNEFTCADGDLQVSPTSDCDIDRVEFDCKVTGNNAGCSKIAYCPAGKNIIGSVAGCNLEYGTVSDSALATIVVNTIRVLRASDSVSQGSCWVGSNSLREGTRNIYWVNGNHGVSVGCKEYDKNGGDCHIHGALYCR